MLSKEKKSLNSQFYSSIFNYLAAPFLLSICLIPIGFPSSGMSTQIEESHLAAVAADEAQIQSLCVDLKTGVLFPWNAATSEGAECSVVKISAERDANFDIL